MAGGVVHAARVVGGALAAVVVVAACGVRPQSDPSAIQPSDVPFGFLEGESGADVPDESGPTETVIVYLLGSEGLFPVEREVARGARARRLLRALVAGPTPAEAELGLLSSFDPEVTPPTVERDGRLFVVDLPEGFLTEGDADRAALAQIVFTLTQFEPSARVQFLLDGEAVEVPRGDGVLTDVPVDRSDYAAVAALPAESAT